MFIQEKNQSPFKKQGGRSGLGLDDLLTKPINGSGFNPDYGLLGSNKSTEESLKLFPREAEGLLLDIQKQIFKKCEKRWKSWSMVTEPLKIHRVKFGN
jgi:hypothetical protein